MYKGKKSKPMNLGVCKLYYFSLLFKIISPFLLLACPVSKEKVQPKGSEAGIILVINNTPLWELRVLHGNTIFQLSVVRGETTCHGIIDICIYFNSADTMTNVSSNMETHVDNTVFKRSLKLNS